MGNLLVFIKYLSSAVYQIRFSFILKWEKCVNGIWKRLKPISVSWENRCKSRYYITNMGAL